MGAYAPRICSVHFRCTRPTYINANSVFNIFYFVILIILYLFNLLRVSNALLVSFYWTTESNVLVFLYYFFHDYLMLHSANLLISAVILVKKIFPHPGTFSAQQKKGPLLHFSNRSRQCQALPDRPHINVQYFKSRIWESGK